MEPETLNAIYCLSCNRSLWTDNDKMPSSILHQIIQEEEKKRKKNWKNSSVEKNKPKIKIMKMIMKLLNFKFFVTCNISNRNRVIVIVP